MKYLIVQDWYNTSGNHTGMRHMCEMLKCFYPSDYEIIVKEDPRGKFYKNKWERRLMERYYRIFRNMTKYEAQYRKLCSNMFKRLTVGDDVFLLEYMNGHSQKDLAFYIKEKHPQVRLYALSHMTPTFWGEHGKYKDMIKNWSFPIDKLLTLGTSLSFFFIENGQPVEKISTGLHYVDHFYYHNEPEPVKGNLKVLMMGYMQRDYSFIKKICDSTPNVDWIICNRHVKEQKILDNCKNVTVHGYLEENELRNIMANADVSLNIMQDTVGSNVVTTSLAMGLALVCSDVGSIRDYCNESNTIFCKNSADSVISAISHLSEHKDLVYSMKKESVKASKRLHIDKIHEWFCSL